MQDRQGEIWLDGRWLPWREATVHVLTHTLHYGYGCFEGLRAYDGDGGAAIFRLDDHLRRLADSAHILAIDLPWSRAEIADRRWPATACAAATCGRCCSSVPRNSASIRPAPPAI